MNVVGKPVSAAKLPREDKTESLNLYNESPTFEMTLDDFEVYALKRLKVSLSFGVLV